MSNKIQSFYDALADHYHLLFEDWDRSIQRQARTLGSLISQQLPGQHLKILDCACGIGIQSLGLAALGHHLIGCDLSPAEIARATKEAQQRGLTIDFRVADMTNLKEVSEAGFDVVSAFDNALPHLTSGELIQALGAVALKLKPGGLFIAGIRDDDALLQQRPAMQQPAFFGADGSRRIIHQVWDWTEDPAYTLHLTSPWKPTTLGIPTTSSPGTGPCSGRSYPMPCAQRVSTSPSGSFPQKAATTSPSFSQNFHSQSRTITNQQGRTTSLVKPNPRSGPKAHRVGVKPNPRWFRFSYSVDPRPAHLPGPANPDQRTRISEIRSAKLDQRNRTSEPSHSTSCITPTQTRSAPLSPRKTAAKMERSILLQLHANLVTPTL
jgi:glycine/sarcosine N-methyltransferase